MRKGNHQILKSVRQKETGGDPGAQQKGLTEPPEQKQLCSLFCSSLSGTENVPFFPTAVRHQYLTLDYSKRE